MSVEWTRPKAPLGTLTIKDSGGDEMAFKAITSERYIEIKMPPNGVTYIELWRSDIPKLIEFLQEFIKEETKP